MARVRAGAGSREAPAWRWSSLALQLALLTSTSTSVSALTASRTSFSASGASASMAPQRLHGVLNVLNPSGASALAATAPRHLHNPVEQLHVPAVTTAHDGGIRVEPDRTSLASGEGEWFTVTWSGVPSPQYDDWVAVVVPATANLTQTAPAKWKFAAGDPAHVETGGGSLRFRLISYRADLAFAFMRGGFDAAVEVARSQPIKVLRPNEPLQLHLALTGQQGEMRVQWNTRDAGPQPQVRWGPEPMSYTGGGGGPAYPHSAAATSSRYEREDMCGGAAATIGWVDAGSHHVALLSGLRPAARYYYRVGDPGPGGGGWSAEHSFWSAPEASPSATVRFLAVADMGQGEVDLTLHGHHHSYQRSCPLYREACQPPHPDGAEAAPVHLVIGHGGAGLSLNLVDPPPAWLKSLGLWWGYARFTADGTALSVEVVADDDGRLLDSFVLRKPPAWGEKFEDARRGRQQQREQQSRHEVQAAQEQQVLALPLRGTQGGVDAGLRQRSQPQQRSQRRSQARQRSQQHTAPHTPHPFPEGEGEGEILSTPPGAESEDVRHRTIMVAEGGLWQGTTLGEGPPPPGPPIDDAVRLFLDDRVEVGVGDRIVEGLVVVETAGDDAGLHRTWPVYAAWLANAGFRQKVVWHLELRG
ncbi:putative inactive purple acid phosphatase 27 [Tetrabaena socialis]|uniref:Putative inactive purple acid phosphatase 27 n=1 Tax=Tetrabaena socialis TaxID=47790 RepID=A0A2J7ZZS4_9CHLO|nr:putative inactive purple acid phosphatase 27 [Tetrabaena socialis]|eukprot:PNH05756.1 putative inactive purple acid phosphatase 27 [Tetrabaena socialis]